MEQKLQNRADLFIRHILWVGEIAFQHCPSGAKPVCLFLSGQHLYLVLQYLFFMLRPPELGFSLCYLLIQFFQLFRERFTVIRLRESAAASSMIGKRINKIPLLSGIPSVRISPSRRAYRILAVLLIGSFTTALGSGTQGGTDGK